jgi:hypothetical protein
LLAFANLLLPTFMPVFADPYCQPLQLAFANVLQLFTSVPRLCYPFAISKLPILFTGLCQPFDAGLCPHLLAFLLAAFNVRPLPILPAVANVYGGLLLDLPT